MPAHQHRFVLYRILGNDLPPRHRAGQTFDNLLYLLDHEPELEDCSKRWIVNRIVDQNAQERIVGLLEERSQLYTRIPFEAQRYAQIQRSFEDFPGREFFSSPAWRALEPGRRVRAIDHTYHRKNLYVMNNNGARNLALREGREHGHWILPLDGSCCFTREGWQALVTVARAAEAARYLVIPMARLLENSELAEADFEPRRFDEPQLGFRWDAIETFDEKLRYGRRSKAELLGRIGVEHWSTSWHRHPWEQADDRAPSVEAGRFATAGWVARLASGQPEQDLAGEEALRLRTQARMRGVRRFLDSLDQRHLEGVSAGLARSAKGPSSRSTRGLSSRLRAARPPDPADDPPRSRSRGPFSIAARSSTARGTSTRRGRFCFAERSFERAYGRHSWKAREDILVVRAKTAPPRSRPVALANHREAGREQCFRLCG